MNEGNKNIDKLFKEAFSGNQFPMDEAMWAEANGMIKASKSSRNYLGVIGATVAVIVLVVTATFLFTGKNLNAKNHTYTERTISNENDILTSSYPENETTFTHQLSVNNNSRSDSKNTPTKDFPHTKNINKASATSSIHHSVKGNGLNASNPKANNTLAMAGFLASNNAPTNSSTKKKAAANPVAKKEPSNIISNEQNQTTSTQSNQFFTDNNFSLNTPKEDFIHLTSMTQMKLVNEPLSENPRSKNGSSNAHMFIPITLRLSAGYGSGSVMSKSYQEPFSSLNANQINIELDLEYMFNYRWGVQLGITYLQTNQTQKYRGLSLEENGYWNFEDNSYWNYFDKEITVEDKTWWLGDWWIYGTYQDTITDSNYVTQMDSNLVQKFDSTQVNLSETQKITQLEIPVMITYNLTHKRWVFQIATGASFGMYLNSNGKMIRFEDDLVTGVNSSKDFFNSLQYNYLLSPEAGFSLNEHWRITARPQLKVNLNSMFNTGSGYSQKYLFYGLNVGMAYNF